MLYVMEGIKVDAETLKQRIMIAHKLKESIDFYNKLDQWNLSESDIKLVMTNDDNYIIGRILNDIEDSTSVVECSRSDALIMESIRNMIGFDGSLKVYAFTK